MITQDNKAIARQFIEQVFNERDLAAIEEFLAPDLIDHTLPPTLPPTREGAQKGISMFLRAVPDLRITIDDIVAEGDKVVLRYTSRGTQRGPFGGVPPTGKEVIIPSYLTARFVDGTIVELWGLDDQLGMLQQLGVIPALFGFVFVVGLGAGIGLTLLVRKAFTLIANTRSMRTNVA